ncbi:MAG: 16S rRNA (cytosine(1402)-N(4))-methyltransferase RsmH, partial [Spirochaetaceae bacterium]|nr:16S rRNA (cytosine(1402)-N(4))-methyltransferase RsmH [Spirochaetaceae bacterium]
MTIIHTPVLLNETLELLDVSNLNNAWMIDATAGEGGHSEAFLSRFPNLRLTAVDADESILESARQRLAPFGGRVNFHRGWSEDFFKSIEDTGGQKPVRILIDLGVSLFHYEQGGRGFSFRKDEPLDMRIDKAGTDAPTAAELVATLREDELAALLWRNAEERYSRRIASSIVKARRYAAIETSSALAAIV